VPALSGVAEPDRLAVRGHVGQHHHFGKARLVKLIGDVDLELAEHAAEARELCGLEPLPREAQHAVRAERPKHLLEVAVRDRLRQVHTLDPGAQCLAAGVDFHALARVLRHARLHGSTGAMHAGSSSGRRAAKAPRLRRTALLDGSCRQGLLAYAVPQKRARRLRRSAALQMMFAGGRHEE
jgi:hypothetical protein